MLKLMKEELLAEVDTAQNRAAEEEREKNKLIETL